jgi:hypothetical protein
MSDQANDGDLIIDRIQNAAGLILGISENRSWIEVFFEATSCIRGRSIFLRIPSLTFMSRKSPIKRRYTNIRARWFFTGPCDVLSTRDAIESSSRVFNPLVNLQGSLKQLVC